jgi:hypothetical protein
VFVDSATGLMGILYFRGVLSVLCVLIATGSCYELLLFRDEHTNSSPGTELSDHKEKQSLGKPKFCPQTEGKRMVSLTSSHVGT